MDPDFERLLPVEGSGAAADVLARQHLLGPSLDDQEVGNSDETAAAAVTLLKLGMARPYKIG